MAKPNDLHPTEMHASEVDDCKRCEGTGKLATKTGKAADVTKESVPWRNVTLEDQRAANFLPTNCPVCGGCGKVKKEKTK